MSTTHHPHSYYQERGVDVIFTDPKSSQNYSSVENKFKKSGPLFTNQNQFILSSKSNTVRSIPIKNFKNSLAQNFGTLRIRPIFPDQRYKAHESLTAKNNNNNNKSVSLRKSKKAEKKTNNNNKQSLEPGTVGAMIQVFEEHLSTDPPCNNWALQKNKFGVPLVGMHNACGLPVLAHWPRQNKAPKKKLKRPAPKPPRSKRQAPKISHEKNSQDRENFCRTQLKSKKNQIEFSKPNSEFKDLGPKIYYEKNSEPAQFRRSVPKIRPHKKNGGDKNKVDFSRPRAASLNFIPKKIESNTTGLKNQANYWNGKKLKRATVYAKDDGSSPVDVLTNLCLNPMARNSSTSNMMW